MNEPSNEAKAVSRYSCAHAIEDDVLLDASAADLCTPVVMTGSGHVDTHVSEAVVAVPERLSAPLVEALERSWAAIRAQHPHVPAAVLVLGAGSVGARAGGMKLGHFAATRWRQGEHDLPEVFVGGEGLSGGAAQVLGTLLHEAAHALAHVRGVQDTSRQGRYHNRRYAALARELGLTVAQTGSIGWSDTSITPELGQRYNAVLDELSAALTLWRHAERPTGGRGRTSSNNPAACVCGCGRRLRASPATPGGRSHHLRSLHPGVRARERRKWMTLYRTTVVLVVTVRY